MSKKVTAFQKKCFSFFPKNAFLFLSLFSFLSFFETNSKIMLFSRRLQKNVQKRIQKICCFAGGFFWMEKPSFKKSCESAKRFFPAVFDTFAPELLDSWAREVSRFLNPPVGFAWGVINAFSPSKQTYNRYDF